MSDQVPPTSSTDSTESDPLPRLVQTLVDQVEATRSVWDRIERQAIPLLERIARALERGDRSNLDAGDQPATRQDPLIDVQAAIDAGQWDRATALVAMLASRQGHESQAEILGMELKMARDRAISTLNGRIEAARMANDAAGALESRDQLTDLLESDDLKVIDREMIGWLMKLIQRRLRIIPITADLANLVVQVADRFGGTPEGASLRAAIPTLRRSVGLCARCAEPYLGVDEVCPKCQGAAGMASGPPQILTFVSADDDLDALVDNAAPLDLNESTTWQIP